MNTHKFPTIGHISNILIDCHKILHKKGSHMRCSHHASGWATHPLTFRINFLLRIILSVFTKFARLSCRRHRWRFNDQPGGQCQLNLYTHTGRHCSSKHIQFHFYGIVIVTYRYLIRVLCKKVFVFIICFSDRGFH